MSIHEKRLAQEKLDALLEPIRDHGHCWGFLARQIIDTEMDKVATRWCEKSRGEHEWVFPRLEDSIDRERKVPPTYCRLCLKSQPHFDLEASILGDKMEMWYKLNGYS